ncbi:MAG: hypothetical protein L7U72_19350 [Rubripirellula sp.]|nr:hypothetical protein [Rubripirellula sp.]
MNAATFTLETVHGVKQSFSLGVIPTVQQAKSQTTQDTGSRQDLAVQDRQSQDSKRLDR